MIIDLLDEAKEDIINGGLFYRRQGGESLKEYFIDSVFASIDSLAWRAGTNSIHYGCYRLLVDKFPYSVYYCIEDDVVKVWRVFDNRRDPEWIERQLIP